MLKINSPSFDPPLRLSLPLIFLFKPDTPLSPPLVEVSRRWWRRILRRGKGDLKNCMTLLSQKKWESRDARRKGFLIPCPDKGIRESSQLGGKTEI